MGLFSKRKKEKEAEYMAKINVPELLKQNFVMTIDDIFTIVGTGTVVTGTVESGMCRVGEQAIIRQERGALETVIIGIDLIGIKDRKPNNCAYCTEHVGLALRGIFKEQIRIGNQIIVKNAYKYTIS